MENEKEKASIVVGKYVIADEDDKNIWITLAETGESMRIPKRKFGKWVGLFFDKEF